MEMIADILLAAGALGAGFYCLVLSRRLKRFNDLEKGVGGAVAVLSAQVDDLNKSLQAARHVSDGSSKALEQLTARAEGAAQRLELMMASMHDLPEVGAAEAERAAAAAEAAKPAAPPAPAAARKTAGSAAAKAAPAATRSTAAAKTSSRSASKTAAKSAAKTPAKSAGKSAAKAETPAKSPGLMFVRHSRKPSQVA